ncbi:MAG: FHA domain-containing protein [Acidobacteriota bacterium]|nr:FHA domain-containing protein [Acidobacteriota bacterium]
MATENCPACGADRETEAVFCQECGYNYATGARPASWEVTVAIDPALKSEESPDPPAAIEPRTIRLHADANLIGRKSEKRAIFPEIALDFDDAVSHRHAMLAKSREGGLALRDLGSANGTRLNGADVPPLTDTQLRNGDEITLGHWTRISVRTTG